MTSVVFPAPDGPTIATVSPLRIVRSMFSRTGSLPYRNDTFSNRIDRANGERRAASGFSGISLSESISSNTRRAEEIASCRAMLTFVTSFSGL